MMLLKKLRERRINKILENIDHRDLLKRYSLLALGCFIIAFSFPDGLLEGGEPLGGKLHLLLGQSAAPEGVLQHGGREAHHLFGHGGADDVHILGAW